jgi:microcystin-dependent protein
MPLILPNTIANAIPVDGDKLQQNFETIQDWANQDAITADGSTGMVAPLLLPGPPTQSNQAATKGYVDGSVPVGVMWEYAGDTAPNGWMLCRGQGISRATYAALYAAIGTRFGPGDGTSTFNIPNMQGRSPMGYWVGGSWAPTIGAQIGSQDSTLPSHYHNANDHLHAVNIDTGTTSSNHFHMEQLGTILADGGDINIRYNDGVTFPAHRLDTSALSTAWASQDHAHNVIGNTGLTDRGLATSYAGGSATNTNLQPNVVLNFIIRVT